LTNVIVVAYMTCEEISNECFNDVIIW